MIRTACAYLILAALVCTRHTQRTATVAITEPGSGTLDNYMNRADVVALVKVVAGDTEAYGVPIYKAEVIQRVQGRSGWSHDYSDASLALDSVGSTFSFSAMSRIPSAPKRARLMRWVRSIMLRSSMKDIARWRPRMSASLEPINNATMASDLHGLCDSTR